MGWAPYFSAFGTVGSFKFSIGSILECILTYKCVYSRTCIKWSPLIQVAQNTSLTWLRKFGDKMVDKEEHGIETDQ